MDLLIVVDRSAHPRATINLAVKYIFLMYLTYAAKAAQNASCICY